MKKRREPLLWIGIGFLVLLVLFAIFGPSIRHPYIGSVGSPHLGPSTQFWLGTDELGQDIFARLAFGARISLKIGLTVLMISLSIGVSVGVLGVFAPNWVRLPLLRFTDGMFAFPDILLAVLIVGMLKPGEFPVIVALSVTSWPSIARLVVTQVASLKDREYVVAARAMGASTF